MSKRTYERMEVTPIQLETSGTLLAASKTATPIKVQNVTVEDFDQGFGTTASDDFKEVSFD